MTDEEFNRHKEALAAQKLEKPKRLSTLFNKFLNEISLQQYHFDRAEKEVAILRNIAKAELLEYYQKYILSTGSNRSTLSIHIVSKAEGGVGNSNEIVEEPIIEYVDRRPDTLLISDLTSFKSSKGLYPLVKPYIDIQPKGAKSKL